MKTFTTRSRRPARPPFVITRAAGWLCLGAWVVAGGTVHAATGDLGGSAYTGLDGEACESEVAEANEDILTIKGTRIKIIEGGLYVCHEGAWKYSTSLKQPAFEHIKIEKLGNRCEITNIRTGQRAPLGTAFTSDFEVNSFFDLFKGGGWTHFTVLSPAVNSVAKYVQLREAMLQSGEASFVDNRIDIESGNVHGGRRAVRFFAVAPGSGAKTSKSLVEKTHLCFAKGDDVWFSGWFYVAQGMPSTLMDIETRELIRSPGVRIFIRRGQYASVELKWLKKRAYNQSAVSVPRDRWFNLKMHLRLSNHDDGVVELWQDGRKIIAANGQTLPTHDTVYFAMQFGITATPRETVLIADDVVISDEPL